MTFARALTRGSSVRLASPPADGSTAASQRQGRCGSQVRPASGRFVFRFYNSAENRFPNAEIADFFLILCRFGDVTMLLI
uniref:Uncharacterized protein n=1 Tax=Paenibacillus athensensis TaxID=1967502 RepID=A0A4Y8Q8I9_9BACL